MTRGVDSSENTLHTTSGNEGKLSWDNTARRKTMAETSSTIYSPQLYIYKKGSHMETDLERMGHVY